MDFTQTKKKECPILGKCLKSNRFFEKKEDNVLNDKKK